MMANETAAIATVQQPMDMLGQAAAGFKLPELSSGFWLTIIVLVGLGALVFLLYTRRYPKITFLIDKEQKTLDFVHYRLDGNQVLDDNILSILLKQQKLKENIEDFSRQFFIGKGWVYLGSVMNGVLHPMRLKYTKEDGSAYLEPDEINQGRRVAIRYYEAQKFANDQVKLQEPLSVGLMLALPIGLVVLVFVLGFYLAQGELMKGLQVSAGISHDTMVLANETISRLDMVLGKSGIPIPVRYNATAGG